MLHRILAAALVAAGLACGSAQAASCPAFPPATITFVPLPSEVQRDTSRSAKDIAATSATPDKAKPVSYEHTAAASVAHKDSVQKLPDGTFCAGVSEVIFKLGYQRKVFIASELADNQCIVNTVVDFEAPQIKADDDALAQFGAGLSKTYAADVKAIGATTGATQDDAVKALKEKVSALLNNKVYADFGKQVAAATATVDTSKWQIDKCDGATAKAFASAGIK